MFKILVVDDEEKIREVIKEFAEFEGNEVFEACDGYDAIEKCKNENFDIIIMDIMMPKIDGFTAYEEIKKIKDIPVLMLSAKSEEYDKLHGFKLGIDDYVVKPFSPKELMARLNVILRRHKNKEILKIDLNRIIFKDLIINLDGRVVKVKDEKIELTLKEFDLLVYLVNNKNIVLTRDKLLNQIWGYDFFGDDRTLDTHIKMLRNSLKDFRKYIVTVRGVGYKFDTTIEN